MKRPHNIGDHALGQDGSHAHAPGDEHDHDHDGMDLLAEGENDEVVLISIGIDVGSSGTQIAFSRLTLEGAAQSDASSDANDSTGIEASGEDGPPLRRDTRRRQTIYQSPVFLTPLGADDLIDERRLDDILLQAFAGAGLSADDIDCGVVILTGAARERANAAAIAARLAEMCGDIVSASAGHHMEARIAAHGSSAVERSATYGARYLNIDIGGATTKLAVCEGGRVTATAALAIGGRLVATDRTDRIIRLEPTGRMHALACGFDWQAGGVAPWPDRQAVGVAMAGKLVAALTGKLDARALDEVSLTGPLPSLEGITGVIVSGGVGEYVYRRETRSFSDLGLPLGRALARLVDEGALPWPLMPAGECIRATVLGASSYTVQLSGRTGLITAPATMLPRRNVPVLRPQYTLGETIDPADVAAAISTHLVAFDLGAEGAEAVARRSDRVCEIRHPANSWGVGSRSSIRPTANGDIVLALGWSGPPEHTRLKPFADGIVQGLRARLHAGCSLYIVIDADIAASLGAILRDEVGLANDILVLDGIALADFDYVDLGRIRLPSGTVPVTIKSLVFPLEQGQEGHKGSRRDRGR